jgi:hypothetical protein
MSSEKSAGISSEQQNLCITPLSKQINAVPRTKPFGLGFEHVQINVQNLILFI